MAVNQGQAVDALEAKRIQKIDDLTTTKRWTPAQIKLIKNTFAVGASDDELDLFLSVCGRTGLDPFTGQIHFVKRWSSARKAEVGSFQIGIGGFRLISQRTGKDRGRLGPWWCGQDGNWKEMWLSPQPPVAAKVGVRHADFEDPIFEVARWDACIQTKKDGTANSFWTIRGPEQLAKCAEAAVRRAAFPQELSDMYADEEGPMMDRLAEPDEITPRPAAAAIKKQETLKVEAEKSFAAVVDEPAKEEEAPGNEAPETPDAPDATEGTQAVSVGDKAYRAALLSDCSVKEMESVLKSLRLASKNTREFYGLKEERMFVKDGKLLIAIESTKNGQPVNAWLDKIHAAGQSWATFAAAIVDAQDELGIGAQG